LAIGASGPADGSDAHQRWLHSIIACPCALGWLRPCHIVGRGDPRRCALFPRMRSPSKTCARSTPSSSTRRAT
jgi:hypothetical protein